MVLAITQLDPVAGLRQVVVLVVAWVHGCTGLHFWLRLRPWYPRVARAVYSGFLLLPVLALLGFAEAGREVARLAREPGFVQAVIQEGRLPDPTVRATLGRVARTIFWGDLAAIALVLAARAWREHVRRRQGVRVGIRAAARCSSRPASRCSRRAASRASRTPRYAEAAAAARPAGSA